MLETLDTLINYTIFNNTIADWALSLAVALFTLTALYLCKRLILEQLYKLASNNHVHSLELVLRTFKEKTSFVVIAALSLYSGAQFLNLSEQIDGIISNILMFALLLQIGLWLASFSSDWIDEFRRKKMEKNPASVTGMNIVRFVVFLAIWSAIALLFLDNLGFDITALVAGLGIGGVAVALALQNILGDLFASLTIVFDKPFSNGDFLIVGDHMGAVESIGLKTTRIRSLSGEQIVVSNGDLLSSRIRNYGRMYERRVPFTIGVTYDTPRDKLKKIPDIIKNAIEAEEKTRFDRSHFKGYGAYSLDFESVYYVASPDYNIYMDIQQAINFSIHEAFEKEGIEFAFPTQTLFMRQEEKTAA